MKCLPCLSPTMVAASWLFLMIPPEVHTQTSLTVANTPGYPGATDAVPVRVAKATNIVAAQFDVAFNPAKVIAGAPTLTAANAGHIVRSREIAPGVRRTIVYSL